MISAYASLRTYLKNAAGIVLDADREYMAESRLAPLVRKFDVSSVDALLARLNTSNDPRLRQDVIEAMTTNETYFFRDRAPFDMFENLVLPALLEQRAEERAIRVWCAGCSTGQEPYSLAMLLDANARRLAGWRVEILATDISTAALDSARQGSYNQFEVQRGLPVSQLLRYFVHEGSQWRLAEHLRARVDFRELNMMSDFSALGPFDLVFCRNILIYFDQATKIDVLRRVANVCRPDAFLVLGAAETLVGLGNAWKPHAIHRGVNIRAA